MGTIQWCPCWLSNQLIQPGASESSDIFVVQNGPQRFCLLFVVLFTDGST